MIRIIVLIIGISFFFKLTKSPVKRKDKIVEIDISEMSDDELLEEIDKYI